MDFIIENGVLKGYEGACPAEITIPDGVTTIRERAFKNSGIKRIILPNSVQTIEPHAFAYCRNLEEVVLPDGLSVIPDSCFAECEKLKAINIPETVESIGDAAFDRCGALHELLIPQATKSIGNGAFFRCHSLSKIILKNKKTKIMGAAFLGCTHLADKNGFVIVGNILFDYIGESKDIKIPEGVEVISPRALEKGNIHFPESLRKIDCKISTDFTDKDGQFHKAVYNVPHLFLQQAKKLNPDTLRPLLRSESWKKGMVNRDYAALLLFQTAKDTLKEINAYSSAHPNEILGEMCEILKEHRKPSYCKTAVEYYFQYKPEIEQKNIDMLYSVSLDLHAKEAMDMLAPYISNKDSVSTNEDAAKAEGTVAESEHPIISYCHENFAPYAMSRYITGLSIKKSVFENVKFKGSEDLAPAFVVECAIVPYMKQEEEVKNTDRRKLGEFNYKSFSFHIDPVADKIAAELDKASFQKALDALLGDGLPSFLQVLVPYGRFSSEKQIEILLARQQEWDVWKDYGSRGKDAVNTSIGAILLNETRVAMLAADKMHILHQSAGIKGVTEDYLRDTVISDFSLDFDGRMFFNFNGVTVGIRLNRDLSIDIVNMQTGEIIENLEELNCNTKDISAVNEKISELKQNIGVVQENRITQLKREFVNRRRRPISYWKETYISNPVIRRIVDSFVWYVEEKNTGHSYGFMLTEDGSAIDADGNPIVLPEEAEVSLAHPISMDIAELNKWRSLLNSAAYTQRFTQIFEPVYTCNTKKLEDRYDGIKLPFYLLKRLESDEYELLGNPENGFEARYSSDIRLDFSTYTPGEENRHIRSIKMIPRDKLVTLYSFRVYGKQMTRVINHALYLIDLLCVETFIRADDVTKLETITDALTERNILRMIDFARDVKSTECMNWLIDYNNINFKNPAKNLSEESAQAKQMVSASSQKSSQTKAKKNKAESNSKPRKSRDFNISPEGVLVKYEGKGKNITIPQGVTRIGESAFGGANISSVAIPEGVEVIDKNAFAYCTELDTVKFPSTLVEIRDAAFCGCEWLKSVALPEGCKKIGNSVFRDCDQLEIIELPSSIEEIGDSAFETWGDTEIHVAPGGLPQSIIDKARD